MAEDETLMERVHRLVTEKKMATQEFQFILAGIGAKPLRKLYENWLNEKRREEARNKASAKIRAHMERLQKLR